MKEFLTIDELSEYLSIKRSGLYSIVESGELPHYRIGRRIRFKRDDVNQWIESHKRQGIDVNKKAKVTLRPTDKPKTDVDRLVKKSIEDVKEILYTPDHGRPDQVRGLRKEVSSGTL